MDREKRIINDLKRNNEQAYKQLFENHYVMMCKVAFEFLKDEYLAKTIANDVILYLWENSNKIEIKYSLRSYLINAVRYSCINYLKKKQVRTEINFSKLSHDYLYEYPLSISPDDLPLGILIEKELEEKIKNAISHLPVESREVFKLSRFEGKTYEEIASALSISVNTVKYHIKNALSKLKADLEKYISLILFLFSVVL